ncbi:SecY-interacting protein [Vibrio sp. NFV-1]|uniref:Protein Syd n=2 Tax=Vibrio nitrifigilis TaxID=2789781 RepID=A0ABS0GMQ7_9VIBR|nr:SecY-interacting protein [Vibrio nitrifigilis]MBF9003627.1 SecY-interacting protein [Vibrio nitrifigilis]
MEKNMSSADSALFSLSQRFVELCQQQTGHLPQDNDLVGLPSPCIEETTDHSVYWLPVVRDSQADFSNIEEAIELTLHPDIALFYGSQYSADIPAQWNNNALTLLQVWSDDDFIRLQENILGHLVMQRRLKQKPTVFIATTDDEMQVVSICNISGEVILETLGSKERQVLAPTLVEFLTQVNPVVY